MMTLKYSDQEYDMCMSINLLTKIMYTLTKTLIEVYFKYVVFDAMA